MNNKNILNKLKDKPFNLESIQLILSSFSNLSGAIVPKNYEKLANAIIEFAEMKQSETMQIYNESKNIRSVECGSFFMIAGRDGEVFRVRNNVAQIFYGGEWNDRFNVAFAPDSIILNYMGIDSKKFVVNNSCVIILSYD